MAGGTEWLEQVSKALPVMIALGSGFAYFLQRFVKSRSNDKEIVALGEALKALLGTIKSIEDKQGRIVSAVEHADKRLVDIEREVTSLRERGERHHGKIEYLLGSQDRERGNRERRDRDQSEDDR